MNTAIVIWAIWIVVSNTGTPIPVSYHGTEAGCKSTLEYARKLAPAKVMECIPGDYAPPPPGNSKQKGNML